ncbi:hypothetical protein BH10BAC6_BH10BAC6_18570 [soil metagenome]
MTIGLFPLNVVLFPQSQLPLHIFEPRYRQLIKECLASGSVFGANLVEKSHLYPVGCTARIVSVTQEYEDGRMDIIVEGVERYTLEGIQEGDRPFFIATVELMTDDVEPLDTALVAKCASLYNEIVDIVYGAAAPRFDPAAFHGDTPSFLLAPKSGLNADQKQHMLELTSENGRLEMLYDHLIEIVPTIRQAEVVQKIIASDGYFPPSKKELPE